MTTNHHDLENVRTQNDAILLETAVYKKRIITDTSSKAHDDNETSFCFHMKENITEF